MMKDHTEWVVHKPRCQKSSEKKNWVGVMRLHLKLYLWNHYLPVFFDKLWHEFNIFNPSSQLRNLKKKQQHNQHKVCLFGAKIPPHDLARPGFFPLDMMAIFQSTGYLGFSVHWRENRNLPLRNNEVSEGAGCFFLDWCKSFVSSYKLRFLLFRHLSFVVLIFGVCFGCWKLELHERYVQN